MLGAAEPATWRNGINRRSLAIQGSLGLIRFILRRDRLYLPLWIVAVVIVNVAYATQMSDFLGDDASRQALLEMLKNPAMVAMMGVSYGTEIGQLYAQFMLIWAAALAAVFNIMLVIRHTRKDEEEGRLEMLSSLPLGRNAQLAATLAVALLADLLIAGFSSACFAAIDIQGIGAGGGAVMSFAVAATGFAFAGLAAFVAQLCATAKVANALAFVALGAAYLLRAMGDVANEALALASPLGLAERVQAWAANLAWPIAVLAAEGLAFFALAFVFSSLRDANAGILPARLGRRHASPWLAGDLGLAWRLTRSLSIGWLAVMFVAGAMYGSIFPDMADFFQNNEMYKQILVGVGGDSTGLVQAFVSFLMCIMAVLAAVPCCMVVMKVKSEEKRGRMEQVLSKSVSRARLFGGYLGIALLLAAALMAACALGIYASAASQMASPPDLGMLFNQAFRYLPALVLLIGLAALLTGAWPQATPLVWIYLVYSFIIMYIGGMLDLPGLLLKVTPFEWLKPLADSLQNNAVQLASTVLVSIIGLVLMVLGAWAYRRRDVG